MLARLAICVLLALVVSRLSIEQFGLLDRLADAREGALGLLLEPSVFYLPGRFGLILKRDRTASSKEGGHGRPSP